MLTDFHRIFWHIIFILKVTNFLKLTWILGYTTLSYTSNKLANRCYGWNSELLNNSN